MAFPFLCMTLAIDKLNGRGLNNTACHNDSVNVVLATEGLPRNTNKSECFNYNGEWANA